MVYLVYKVVNTYILFLSLHQFDLFIRQSVQLLHQEVDLGIGGVDLALEEGFFGGGEGCGKLLVKREMPECPTSCKNPLSCLLFVGEVVWRAVEERCGGCSGFDGVDRFLMFLIKYTPH